MNDQTRFPEIVPRRERGKIIWAAIIITAIALIVVCLSVSNTIPSTAAPIVTALALVALFAMVLRYQFPDEVYLLFLAFFGVTYLTVLVFIFLDRNNYVQGNFLVPGFTKGANDGGWLASAGSWYVKTSKEFGNETSVLAAVTGLILVPQFLSFLFSGLFGSARQPIFVSRVIQFGMISLMKCCCAFAAVAAGSGIFIIYKIYTQDNASPFPGEYFKLSALFLSYAFVIAALYYLYVPIVAFLIRKDPTGLLNRARNYMTKYTREQMAREAAGQASILASLSTAAIETVAFALYGETWRRRLAEELKVAEKTIRDWAGGDIPTQIVRELEARCRDHGAELLAKQIADDAALAQARARACPSPPPQPTATIALADRAEPILGRLLRNGSDDN